MLKLDINLLWTVVNVLIMYALLRKFLFKPVQDVLDKRQKMVDDELANAQDAKTKAEAALAAANDKLHNVDVEAAARREESAQQAEKQKEQLLAEAQRQADAIVAEGKAAAEAERASNRIMSSFIISLNSVGLSAFNLCWLIRFSNIGLSSTGS